MRGAYVASYQATGVSAAKTLMYITAPATACVEIFSAKVTEVGVTTAEQYDIGLAKITTLGTPTATTITPKVTETGTSVSACVVKANVTANEPTYEVDGGSVPLYLDHQGVSNVAGYYYDPLPEERPIIAPSATFGLKLLANPVTSIGFLNIEISYREIG